MLPFIVLSLMVLLAGTLTYSGWLGVVALVAASIWWSRVNKPIEGKVLWTLTPHHGITAADLAGFAGLVVALSRAVHLAG